MTEDQSNIVACARTVVAQSMIIPDEFDDHVLLFSINLPAMTKVVDHPRSELELD
jgi:hypothetical protein